MPTTATSGSAVWADAKERKRRVKTTEGDKARGSQAFAQRPQQASSTECVPSLHTRTHTISTHTERGGT